MRFVLVTSVTVFLLACAKSADNPAPHPDPKPVTNDVDLWLTKADQSVKLEKQTAVLGFGTTYNMYSNIEVDDNQTFQSIDGFGYTLTGGSAQVINLLSATKKQELLQELFGTANNSISISYLRISIGASDLDSAPFTYDDMPAGQTDINQANFCLAPNMTNLIPLLKEIITINPSIKIIAAPWSAPVWMKDNNSFIGGSLLPQYYGAYAQYFVKYIQKMKSEGITVNAKSFIDGSAFHLYAGDISALSLVHNSFPEKNIYFTEQFTSSTGSFDGDLKWHLKSFNR